MGIFHPDSPFIQEMDKVTDYIILNFLWVLCCLPIFTIGTATTAKFYVSLKLVRNEDVPVAKAFFKAFKENFKQTTPIWLVGMLLGAFLALDWYQILWGQGMTTTFKVLIFVMTFVYWAVFLCIFAILAYYNANTKEAVKGGVVMTIITAHKLILIFLGTIIPYFVALWYVKWALAIWMVSTSVVLYYASRMLNKELSKITGKVEE